MSRKNIRTIKFKKSNYFRDYIKKNWYKKLWDYEVSQKKLQNFVDIQQGYIYIHKDHV